MRKSFGCHSARALVADPPEASEAMEHRPWERLGMAVEHRRTQPQRVDDEGRTRSLFLDGDFLELLWQFVFYDFDDRWCSLKRLDWNNKRIIGTLVALMNPSGVPFQMLGEFDHHRVVESLRPGFGESP